MARDIMKLLITVHAACKRGHKLLFASAEDLQALSRQLHGPCAQQPQLYNFGNVRSAASSKRCSRLSAFKHLGLNVAISRQVLSAVQGKRQYLQQQHLALPSSALQQQLSSQQLMGLRTYAGRKPVKGKTGRAMTGRQPTSRSTQQQPAELDHQHHQQQHHQNSRHRNHEQQGLTPSRLTSLITSSSTPRELLECVVFNHQLLNRIHIRTAIIQASKLWQKTAVPGHDDNSTSSVTTIERQQLEKLMLQLSGPFVRTLPDCSASEIAAVLKAYAVRNVHPPAELLDACVQEVITWDKLQQAEPMAVTKLTWAAAYLGCRDQQLYSRAAAAALSGLVQQYTPAQVSTMTWACAKAGYFDNALGLALTARAVELLQRQLRQATAESTGRKAQRQDAAWKFQAGHLSSLLWASTVGGWLSQTPELMQMSAALAVQEPFAYDFSIQQASNFAWSFASSLEHHTHRGHQRTLRPSTNTPAAAGEVVTVSSSDGHESGTDGGEACAEARVHSEAAGQPAAAAAHVLDAEQVWQSNLRVVTAALRRPALVTDAVSLSRLVWSLGTLYGWVDTRLMQQRHVEVTADEARPNNEYRSPAEQRALADGSVVFDQLCAAHARLYQLDAGTIPRTAAMTAWGLVAASEHSLWQMPAPSGALVQPEDTAAPMQLLQALLKRIQQTSRQLHVNNVADLLTAMVELKSRLEAQVLLMKHRHTESRPQKEQGKMVPEELDAAVADTLPVHLLQELTSAVGALTAAAHQLASAQDKLPVYHASRILASLCQLQVEDDAVCIQLLQHLDKDALEGCSSNGLGMALHAAAGFGAAHVDVITSGKLPVSFWEQLIAAAKNRSEELMSNDYSGSAKAAVRSLTNTLKRVVDHQLLHDLRMSYKRTA